MKQYLAILLLLAGFCATAQADVWKWVDAQGKTHFVDTNTPIYTWVDASGDVSNRFEPYDYVTNRQLMDRTFPVIINRLPPGALEAMAFYPDSVTCTLDSPDPEPPPEEDPDWGVGCTATGRDGGLLGLLLALACVAVLGGRRRPSQERSWHRSAG